MSKLELKKIYMNYHTHVGETPALNNVNLNVEAGEFVSLVGPSGCGKSTILNILAGLIKPLQGEVLFNDKLINKDFYKLDYIGYMFQQDQLFEWLDVWRNITLGPRIQHKVTSDIFAYLEKLLKEYNLWDFRHHKPSQLSGGMRQKVALIRTLALNPQVLLLDEPFSALDYVNRLNIGNEIYAIIKNEKKTVLMVTHDIAEAVSVSDRVLVLSKRPSYVKREVCINFSPEYPTPILRRRSPDFSGYFNSIWKEMEIND
ncbi:ABC transporter ATP-binding protein [Clostridium sp. 19966]|uniref:ABC transporter ATP-binding protein n=1 Tax=Clostridium sp. 19966 TaxID=2768166 RepID=UPI0028DEB48A|nr:ABC transporter ATP-binding protein [Clostridium sp. 19966]MDT8719476.1 ABC transporter ATP-binding protein [Clostridium sp. 19966]